MKQFKVTFYDYWQRRTDITEAVEAASENEAKAKVMANHPEIGTAIVFVRIRAA